MDAITTSGDKTAKDTPDLPSIIASNSKPRPLVTFSGDKTTVESAQDALDLLSVIASNERDTKAAKTNDVDQLPPSNLNSRLESLEKAQEDMQQDLEDIRQNIEDLRQNMAGVWRFSTTGT